MKKNIFSFYKDISIRQKMLLIFSIQIIIPIFFMGIMLYRNTENIIQNKSITYAMDIMKMIELRLRDFEDTIKNTSQDLLYEDLLYDVLHGDNSNAFTFYQKVDKLKSSLRQATLSNEEIQSIALISNTNKYYTYNTNSSKATIENLIDLPILKENAHADDGQHTWFFDTNEDDTIKHIYLVRTVYDISDFTELGFMIVLIKDNYLETIYNELSTEFMEDIIIIGNNNEILSYTSLEAVETIHQYSKQLSSEPSGYFIDPKTDHLISYINSSQHDFNVVSNISLRNLNHDLYIFRNWLVLLIILTLLILSIFTILMAIDIIDPIKNIVIGMKKMQTNQAHEPVVIDRNDELGYLSIAFNNMSEEIDLLLNQVYKEQITRKDAELKALQSQINPHFLFNTLESINWMARLNDSPEISDMVTALSTLMEASIGKGNPNITLKEEIAHAESYILIMKNRYGDRLTYEKQIDDTLLPIKIPKLTLQPIIENAIYHGIDKMRKGGTITLKVFRSGSLCVIEIRDDGPGMTKEQVIELNTNFRINNDNFLLDTSKKSIGLVNVNNRIKLLYGNDYGLKLATFKDGTMLWINLPADPHFSLSNKPIPPKTMEIHNE